MSEESAVKSKLFRNKKKIGFSEHQCSWHVPMQRDKGYHRNVEGNETAPNDDTVLRGGQ